MKIRNILYVFLCAIILLRGIPVLSQPVLTPDTLSVIGVGDIMLGTDYPRDAYLPPNRDCSQLMESVHAVLQEADVTFGNLEGVFAGNKGRAKICRDTMNCYVFRMPAEFVNCLVDAGFDMVSLANNHSVDFGLEGRKNTMKVLDDANIAHAGSLEFPTAVVEKDSVRYGLCAFAPNRGACNLIDTEGAKQIVQELSKRCDVVIVSFHGGAEGKDHQHVTRESETFLGYDRGNVYKFAHEMIDAGADVIFGHGPHVTRAVEIYKNRFISYSLGNFCTYARFNLKGPNGIAPIIKIYIDTEGKFLFGEVVSVYQAGKGITKIDPEHRALKKLQELTSSDFPEVPVHISDEGRIVYQEL